MAKEIVPWKSFPTVCGARECLCSTIMGHLIGSKTPFFFADNNFTRSMGPGLPEEFVQQHEHELAMEVVILEAAGQAFAVQLIIGEPGNKASVSMGLGWEYFMVNAKFHAEDLLFFILQDQSTFTVVPVRGHNRRKTDGEGEVPHLERRLSDVLKQGEASSQVKRVVEERNPGQTSKDPTLGSRFPLPPTLGSGEGSASHEAMPKQDLTTDSERASDRGKHQITPLYSHGGQDSYMLSESSKSGNEDAEMGEASDFFEADCSDSEDEREFKRLRR